MSSLPLMFQPLAKYVDFQGRSRRSEFWLWVLFRVIVGMILGTVTVTMLFNGMNFQTPDPQQFMGRYFQVMPLMNIVNLALLLPTIAVGVRRLHDINRTGWWVAMPIVVTIGGVLLFFIIFGAQIFNIYGQSAEMSQAQSLKFAMGMFGSLFLCIILPVIISQIVMLIFYVTDGTPHANRFGDDPKGRGLTTKPQDVF